MTRKPVFKALQIIIMIRQQHTSHTITYSSTQLHRNTYHEQPQRLIVKQAASTPTKTVKTATHKRRINKPTKP
jgi:hypothetical protein